jgi:hypothetical protein
MSHHFDTPTAREDPRLNIGDFYLFNRRPGYTVMAMTVNPNAGTKAPQTFRDEGVYAFRFDLNGDAKEELTFRVLFGEVTHTEDGHHQQTVTLLIADGNDAAHGIGGRTLAVGITNEIIDSGPGIRLFAGLAPDLFAADSLGLHAFKDALTADNFEPAAYNGHNNYFANHNVTAIVVEVPDELIGFGHVNAWATVSLHGHAPEVQVSRWGFPLLTHFFILDAESQEAYNRSTPSDDTGATETLIRKAVARTVSLAGSAPDPDTYAEAVVRRLIPTALPYNIGSRASFDFTSFNGRELGDDVMDVMLTIWTNTALGDGVRPDKKLMSDTFPYFGRPYNLKDLIR